MVERSVEKCCYMDIVKICIHPCKDYDPPISCKPHECNYYFEGEWYFPELSTKSQQLRTKNNPTEVN